MRSLQSKHPSSHNLPSEHLVNRLTYSSFEATVPLTVGNPAQVFWVHPAILALIPSPSCFLTETPRTVSHLLDYLYLLHYRHQRLIQLFQLYPLCDSRDLIKVHALASKLSITVLSNRTIGELRGWHTWNNVCLLDDIDFSHLDPWCSDGSSTSSTASSVVYWPDEVEQQSFTSRLLVDAEPEQLFTYLVHTIAWVKLQQPAALKMLCPEGWKGWKRKAEQLEESEAGRQAKKLIEDMKGIVGDPRDGGECMLHLHKEG